MALRRNPVRLEIHTPVGRWSEGFSLALLPCLYKVCNEMLPLSLLSHNVENILCIVAVIFPRRSNLETLKLPLNFSITIMYTQIEY